MIIVPSGNVAKCRFKEFSLNHLTILDHNDLTLFEDQYFSDHPYPLPVAATNRHLLIRQPFYRTISRRYRLCDHGDPCETRIERTTVARERILRAKIVLW